MGGEKNISEGDEREFDRGRWRPGRYGERKRSRKIGGDRNTDRW